MEINRNQYFMIGLVVLLLGVQLRFVDSFVLNEKATRFLIERSNKAEVRSINLLPAAGPAVRKVVRPPEWLGWALMSVGSVLILHSLAMPRPA